MPATKKKPAAVASANSTGRLADTEVTITSVPARPAIATAPGISGPRREAIHPNANPPAIPPRFAAAEAVAPVEGVKPASTTICGNQLHTKYTVMRYRKLMIDIRIVSDIAAGAKIARRPWLLRSGTRGIALNGA